MGVLGAKLFRDLWKNKGQFISIFIMVLLGVMAFSGIHAYMDGMKVSGEQFYESCNLADLWLAGERFTRDDLQTVRHIDGVQGAERKLTFKANLEGYKNTSMEVNFIESNNISKFHVTAGTGFDVNKKGVWVDAYLASARGIRVGDTLSLTYEGYTLTEPVLGLIYTPDHVYSIKDEASIFPTHDDYGFCYMSVNEFPKQAVFDAVREYVRKNGADTLKQYGFSDLKSLLHQSSSLDVTEYIFGEVIVDVSESANIKTVKAEIENTVSAAKAVTTRDDQLSYSGYLREAEEGEAYSGIFTFLFLFIAVLSVVTTMYRFIKKERVQIGTLKSLGVKKWRIVLHYTSYGFFISLFAAVAGLLLGYFLIGNFFMEMEMEYYEVAEYAAVFLPVVYIMAAATVLFITLVSYLSCRGVLKEKAADAIRTEKPKVKSFKRDITKLKIFARASLSTKWNLRDIARNKLRTLTTTAGIIGCSVILVAAFGMLDTMNSYMDWEFGSINDYAYKVVLSENVSNKQLAALTKAYGDKTSQTLAIEFENGDTKTANTLSVNDAEGLLNATGHDKKPTSLGDGSGIYITERLSETISKTVGDTVRWHVFGEDTWYTSSIVGTVRDPQMQSFTCNKAFLSSLGREYAPDTLYTNADLSGVKSLDGATQIMSIEAVQNGFSSMLGAMYAMIALLIVISTVLGFVIVYNLGGLSFTEKQYQFATLKVLGFRNSQIKKIFVKQNIWLTVIAVLIAMPLGYYMVDYIFTEGIGGDYDFPAVIGVMSYLYATVGTAIVSLLVNLFLARKVKKIDMVTSLKGNE